MSAILVSQAMFLAINWKLLLISVIVGFIGAIYLANHYWKVLVLILVMAGIPFIKCGVNLSYSLMPNNWHEQKDDILNAKFVTTPNVYMIQPDGYVGRSVMEDSLYNFSSSLYKWLEEKEFKVYDDFRSNYPASLSSNSSMFIMRHHYFGDVINPKWDMVFTRDFIAGKNPVIDIFKSNGYKTHFIVEDEYFQQNRPNKSYDYYNIDYSEIPYFSNDNNVKKDVFKDFRNIFNKSKDSKKPNFFFIEKLLPHHVHFKAEKNRVEAERKEYLAKIDITNDWIEKIVLEISKNDPNGIIIVAADHGGWVGLNSFTELAMVEKEELVRSVFSNLVAIKWNEIDAFPYDKDLKTNVNIFRVLFSALSQNSTYLKSLEEDSSYNVRHGSFFLESVYKLIDKHNNVVLEKR
ncbi:sulfatase-like hydrolase/transferase [Algibacter amylolyticus]|nr:sulfatase-like hydrolase/transferase [Algibacter amylolyticus]MBB5269607.1 hypothetical protein [Algibacter amylolyticus]